MRFTKFKLLQPQTVPLCGHEIANTYIAQISQVEWYVLYFSLFKKGRCQNITLKYSKSVFITHSRNIYYIYLADHLNDGYR